MKKRFLALLLCLIMCLSVFTACAGKSDLEDDEKGAYITMFLTNEITNFDPAYAYDNEEAESIVSLLFARLFTLDEDGDVVGDLATEYVFKKNDKTGEIAMEISMRDAWWSDKTKVTAEDVVYAWKRILNAENSFSCAALLYDIRNARAVKAGNCSIDDLGVCALNDTTLRIDFEEDIDYDQFLVNLTSLALAPLREDYASKGDDWAKKSSTMVTSGPFKISKTAVYYNKDEKIYVDDYKFEKNKDTGLFEQKSSMEPAGYFTLFALERNAYYLRDPGEDLPLDYSVSPYRIIVNCIRTDEEIKTAYENNEIFYLGYIPVSLRGDSAFMKKANVKDALATQSFYINENALIKKTADPKAAGEAIFANEKVRQALSLALDREAIASALVLADPATGLIPNGVFEKVTSGSFRKNGGALIETSANISAASALLAEAGIKASEYTFSLKYNPDDDQSTLTATMAAEAWKQLGFDVQLTPRGTIPNNEYNASIDSTPDDILDDLLLDDKIHLDYEVMLMDMCMYSADAYSALAPFALNFSGMVDKDFNQISHISGYNSEEYNQLIEAIFYLQYYSKVTAADYASFAGYESEEAFKAVLDACAAVYEKYDIDTSKNDLSAARAKLLHVAEEMIVDDMPIIPVTFLKTATLCNTKALSKVGEGNYYSQYDFTKTKLKNFRDYVEAFEEIYANKK